MSATVGEAVIQLRFDGSKAETDAEKSGSSAGKKFGSAWEVAAGSLIAKGVSKIASSISNNLGKAINRVDIVRNFPKVMTALGYSSEEASSSIDKISGSLDGLPTSLDAAVSDIQKLASTMGNLNTGAVNATSVGLALNNMFLAGGKGTEVASRAMEQYNQMLAAGKADMQSWRSMLDAAPGQLKQLAKTLLGATATQEDLRQAINNGTISFDDMNKAIVELNQNGGDGFASFEKQARSATGGIGTALENVQNRIAKAIAKIIDRLDSEKIAAFINEVSASFSGLADGVINIIDFISSNRWVLDMITAFFVGLLGMGIATKISAFFTMLSGFAATNPVVLAIGAISAVLFLLITHIEEVGQFFQDTFGGVAEFIGGVCSTIGEFFGGLWQWLTEAIQNVADFFQNTFGAVADFLNGVCTSVAGFFTGLWDGFKNGVQGAWNFITSIFSNLANFFGSIFSNAWTAVKNVFSTGGKIFMGIVDGIVSAFRNIVNVIINGINAVVAIPFNAINGFLSFLKSIDILGIKPFDWVGTISVPQIPLLAQGGYADGATTAIIGEEGKEAVLPLEHNTDNWAGLLASTLVEEMGERGKSGSTINVYMTNEINNELDANEIGRLMMESIRRAA